MQAANGSYNETAYPTYEQQQDYQQQPVTGGGNTSEVFYQLVRAGVSEDVASQVDRLVESGILADADISEKVSSELVNLPAELMSQITNELVSSDVSNLKNKAAYLIGLIKTQKKKVPGLHEPDSMAGGDPVGSIDISQLNISYGKTYNSGLGLGPNVNEEAIKRLLLRTGYKLDLSPGQRQYGPPPNWQGDKPRKGCEVFIGGLLRETFEDSLVPMLEECGMLFDLRIMTNPTDGVNKGFAFAIFASPEAAKSCVSRLNGKSMGRNRTLKVNVHNPNTRLFVGGVDKSKNRDQIISAISQHTEGLMDVILKGDSEHAYNKHRGFVFLDYDEHKQASQAIKKLMLPSTFVFGKNLFADWAEPMAEVSDEIMATVKVLYVKGLTPCVTEELLKDRFSPYGSIDNVKKLKDYAFVHFQQREDALQAMNDLNGTRVEDCNIDVTLAKPGNKKKDMSGGRGGFDGRGGGMRGRGGPMRGGPPMRGRGGPPTRGFGGPPRGGRGGPRPGGPRPGGPPSYGRYDEGGYGSGYDSSPLASKDRYGGYDSYGGSYDSTPAARSYNGGGASGGYGSASGGYGSGSGGYGGGYRAPAPGAAAARGRGVPRGSPRGAASSYGARGRGAAPAPPRGGGVKRPAAPAEPAYGAAPSSYGSTYPSSTYESPAMKRTKSYDDWGAAPIAQQPLSTSYTPPSRPAESWYTDQY